MGSLGRMFFQFLIISLEEGSAHYNLETKCGPSPIFMNKVLMEQSHIHLFPYYLWLFYAVRAELCNCDQDHMARKTKIFTFWPFIEKVFQPPP